MRAVFRRIIRDILHRTNIEAYVLSFTAFGLAVGSALNDVIPVQLKWSVLLAAVGLLVYRMALPGDAGLSADELLQDRTDFEDLTLSARLRTCKELWIFGPSATGILTDATCQLLRETVLSRAGGIVRIVVLDPDREDSIRIASEHLDGSLDFPLQNLETSVRDTLRKLETMAGWQVSGTLEYRKFGYNPGFSIVAFDPSSRNGRIIVEFHGIHNESTSTRMHIELGRARSERWYGYWVGQFHRIWQTSTPS